MLRWRNRVWSRMVAALSEGLRYAPEVVPRVRVLSGGGGARAHVISPKVPCYSHCNVREGLTLGNLDQQQARHLFLGVSTPRCQFSAFVASSPQGRYVKASAFLTRYVWGHQPPAPSPVPASQSHSDPTNDRCAPGCGNISPCDFPSIALLVNHLAENGEWLDTYYLRYLEHLPSSS